MDVGIDSNGRDKIVSVALRVKLESKRNLNYGKTSSASKLLRRNSTACDRLSNNSDWEKGRRALHWTDNFTPTDD